MSNNIYAKFNIDRQIAHVIECKILPENDVKILCELVGIM
jgi:hypothetical protein